jgi:hypothetical protein
MKRM